MLHGAWFSLGSAFSKMYHFDMMRKHRFLLACNEFRVIPLLYGFLPEPRQRFDTEVATFALCTLNEAEVYNQESIVPALL